MAYQKLEGGRVAREEMELACFPGVGVKLNDSGCAQDCAPFLCGDVKRQSRFRNVCLLVL